MRALVQRVSQASVRIEGEMTELRWETVYRRFLVENDERKVLSHEGRGRGLGNHEHDLAAGAGAEGLGPRSAVHGDLAGREGLLDAVAAQLGQAVGQEPVKALALLRFGDPEGHPVTHGHGRRAGR